jgi:dihydrofolate synthase/folylpolyglutamate synthase
MAAEAPVARSLADWLQHIDAVHPRDIEMGLDRVIRVAERLDVRQPGRQTVIVAGTNGKGSTCVALESLLLTEGLSVGTTLSPHVERFNERVRIGGRDLDDDALCDLFQTVETARADVSLTYFEFSALVALLAFREAAVDVAILEVGLGGRLDAFNLVDADVAVVTSIGLDHQDYLGDDVETIGREKAGVFRQGQTVVLGDVTDSVRSRAAELECRTLELGREIQVEATASDWSVRVPGLGIDTGPQPNGILAPQNCALALAVTAVLAPGRVPQVGSLSEVRLPGRMETHRYADRPVIVDVAHNPAGAAFLDRELVRRFQGMRFVGIIGTLADKDAAGVVAALGDRVASWIAVPTRGWRAQAAAALQGRLAAQGRPVEACDSMAEALAAAASLTDRGDGILVVGSFSAVEQAREALAASAPQLQ